MNYMTVDRIAIHSNCVTVLACILLYCEKNALYSKHKDTFQKHRCEIIL